MRDVQTALSPLVPSVGQVMPPKGELIVSDGMQSFGTHLDLLPVDGVEQTSVEEDATGTVDTAANAHDLPIGVPPAVIAAPILDRTASGRWDFSMTAPPGVERPTPVLPVQNGGRMPPLPGEGGEGRINDPGEARGQPFPRIDQSGRVVIAQDPTPDLAQIELALGNAQSGCDARASTRPNAEPAEREALRKALPTDVTRASPPSGAATPVEVPEIVPDKPPAAPAVRPVFTGEVPPEPSDGTAVPVPPDKTAQPLEQASALRPGAIHADMRLRPAPDPSKRGMKTDTPDAGDDRSPPVAQIKVETNRKAPFSVPAVAARPGEGQAAPGGLFQAIEAKEVQGKSTGTTNESEVLGTANPAPLAAARGTPTVPQAAAADIPRQIATQLADAMPQAHGRDVEISLNPQELGRVRISLNAHDAGVSMAITAERGETLDLMRRHIDQLAQEFRDLGYGDVSFSFGQSGQGQEQGDPQSVADRMAAPEPQDISPRLIVPQRPIINESGLDLRI